MFCINNIYLFIVEIYMASSEMAYEIGNCHCSKYYLPPLQAPCISSAVAAVTFKTLVVDVVAAAVEVAAPVVDVVAAAVDVASFAVDVVVAAVNVAVAGTLVARRLRSFPPWRTHRRRRR